MKSSNLSLRSGRTKEADGGNWFVAVKAMPVGSKPPAAVGERNFNGERRVFGAAAPFSTKT